MIRAVIAILAGASVVLAQRPRTDEDVNRAILAAMDFIRSQQEVNSLVWKFPRETGAAILGLTSGDVSWKVNRADHPRSVQIIKEYNTAIQASLLRIKDEEKKGLESFDDTTLGTMITAAQISCQNPANLLGFNLVEEAVQRVANTAQRSPSLAGLSLPLCLYGHKFTSEQLQRLTIPKRNDFFVCRHLCMEKAALNILVLNCAYRSNSYSDSEKRLILQLIRQNRYYISQFFPTAKLSLTDRALLLQVNDIKSVRAESSNIDMAAVFEDLIKLQGSDGSFGGSVSLTALSIPALSHFSALDVIRSSCEHALVQPKASLTYEVIDNFGNTQSIFGEFNATFSNGNDISLHELIRQFDAKYPDILRFKSTKSIFGPGHSILQLVGIPVTSINTWVVQVERDANRFQVFDFDKPSLRRGDKLLFSLERS